MANIKISALPSFTDAQGIDKVPVVDVSSGDTKAYTIEQLLSGTYSIDGFKTYTNNASWTSTGYIQLPIGTVAQRPSSPANGMIRYNSDNNNYEYYLNGIWNNNLTATQNGALLLPFGTTVQRPGNVQGYLRFNTDLSVFEGYNGTAWGQVGGGQMYGTAITKVISYNEQTINENITVQATHNASAVGPITVSNGFTVSIQPGGRWVIL